MDSNRPKQITGAQRITFGILAFLMVERFAGTILLTWVWRADAPYWWEVVTRLSAYPLIAISVWTNRKNLLDLNIDRRFLLLFVSIGGIYALAMPPVFGILIGATACIVLIAYWSGSFQVTNFYPVPWQAYTFMILFLVPDILLIASTGKWPNLWNSSLLLQALFMASPIQVIFEEAIFRGMLWAFLKTLGMKENSIIVTQAVAFWLAHLYHVAAKPLLFWLILPLSSVLLGLIVALSSRQHSPGWLTSCIIC